MEDVYVDLSSNASLSLYPDNRVSRFKVKLDQPLELVGAFECALTQMISPAATELKQRGYFVLGFFPKTEKMTSKGKDPEQVPPYNKRESMYIPEPNQPLPAGYLSLPPDYTHDKAVAFTYEIPQETVFSGIQDLVGHIRKIFQGDASLKTKSNKNFIDATKSLKIIQNKVFGQDVPAESDNYVINLKMSGDSLDITLRDDRINLSISSELARVLGFPVADGEWVTLSKAGVYRAPAKADLEASRTNLISVYTNVILPHRVGDTSAPLIRTCTIPHQRKHAGDLLNLEFVNLHYLRVATNYIQEIAVEVRGIDGKLIPFEAGILYVRLHFRPILGRR